MCPPSQPPAHRYPNYSRSSATARTNPSSIALASGPTGSESAFEPSPGPSTEHSSENLYSPYHDSADETAETSAGGSASFITPVRGSENSHDETPYESGAHEQSGPIPAVGSGSDVRAETYSAERDVLFGPAFYSTSNTNSARNATSYGREPSSDVESGMESASPLVLETSSNSYTTSFNVSASESAPQNVFDPALVLEKSGTSGSPKVPSLVEEQDNDLATENSEIHPVPIADPIPCLGTFSVTKIVPPRESFSESYSDSSIGHYSDVFDGGIHPRTSNTLNTAVEEDALASGSRLNASDPDVHRSTVQNSSNTSENVRSAIVDGHRPLTSDPMEADNVESEQLIVVEDFAQQPVERSQDSHVLRMETAAEHGSNNLPDDEEPPLQEKSNVVSVDQEHQDASAGVAGQISVDNIDNSAGDDSPGSAGNGGEPDTPSDRQREAECEEQSPKGSVPEV